MAPSISENLSRIHNSAAEFDNAASKVSVLVREVEKRLGETVPKVESGEKKFLQAPRDFYTLLYGRNDDDKWGLIVRHYLAKKQQPSAVDLGFGDVQWNAAPEWSRSLSATSRDIRMTAAPYINAVLEDLADKIELSVGRLKEEEKKINELLEAVLPSTTPANTTENKTTKITKTPIKARIVVDDVEHIRFPGVEGVVAKLRHWHLAKDSEHLRSAIAGKELKFYDRHLMKPPFNGDVIEVEFV